MKRILRAFSIVTVFAAASAVARDRPYDPAALAHYDASYGRCEAQFPDMKGHRDEAYVSLWRSTLNERTRTRLSDARASAAYKAERARAGARGGQPESKEAAKKLEQECLALRGEMRRVRK